MLEILAGIVTVCKAIPALNSLVAQFVAMYKLMESENIDQEYEDKQKQVTKLVAQYKDAISKGDKDAQKDAFRKLVTTR